MTLTEHDIAALAARWITSELAERAGLFRVNSADGAGDYSGIIIPNLLPGHEQPREYRLRRNHPDLESRPDGSTHEKAKYLNPPGRGNLIYTIPGTPREWLTKQACQ